MNCNPFDGVLFMFVADTGGADPSIKNAGRIAMAAAEII